MVYVDPVALRPGVVEPAVERRQVLAAPAVSSRSARSCVETGSACSCATRARGSRRNSARASSASFRRPIRLRPGARAVRVSGLYITPAARRTDARQYRIREPGGRRHHVLGRVPAHHTRQPPPGHVLIRGAFRPAAPLARAPFARKRRSATYFERGQPPFPSKRGHPSRGGLTPFASKRGLPPF